MLGLGRCCQDSAYSASTSSEFGSPAPAGKAKCDSTSVAPASGECWGRAERGGSLELPGQPVSRLHELQVQSETLSQKPEWRATKNDENVGISSLHVQYVHVHISHIYTKCTGNS